MDYQKLEVIVAILVLAGGLIGIYVRQATTSARHDERLKHIENTSIPELKATFNQIKDTIDKIWNKLSEKVDK